jgi:hypothetical protein
MKPANQQIAKSSGMKKTSAVVCPGIRETRIAVLARMTASPIAALRASRTFPSRNAAANPTAKKLSADGSRIGSMNAIPAPRSQ